MTTYTLPLQNTLLIGRSTELLEISALLAQPACRLLTLAGPGGIGKTRLALEVIEKQAAVFPDGTFFVPLQALVSSEFLLSTIALALGFRFQAGADIEQQLWDYLHDKSLLLLLDNFEHLLDGVGVISDSLLAAPDVKVLVTSRERLNLREEWVYEVHGLAVPAHDSELDIEGYSAVQLFAHHARRVHQGFRLTSAYKPPVTRICRMVGGMPLGIELASAWVRVLPCHEIASEIERSLDILETPARNVEPRHRTMRAAFDPTWKRLSAEERGVFKKLSLFRGGFTREAAEVVAGASLRTLSSLVDKSLLRLNENGRYSIHELLRQYGEEHLNASQNEREETLNLHRAYYMGILGECEQMIVFLGQQKEAIAKIDQDFENIRLAWQRAVIQGQFQEMSAAFEGLWGFY